MNTPRICEECLRATSSDRCPHHPWAELLDEKQQDTPETRRYLVVVTLLMVTLALMVVLFPRTAILVCVVLVWALFLSIGLLFPMFLLYQGIQKERRATIVWLGLFGSWSLMLGLEALKRNVHTLPEPVAILLGVSQLGAHMFAALLIVHVFTLLHEHYHKD